jgi:GTPase SAR1 family protein
MMELRVKVAVLGDAFSGKTALCQLLESPLAPPSPREPPRKKIDKEHYFIDLHRSRPFAQLQLIDQPGIDRFSLQPIVFRSVAASIVAVDATLMFKEFLYDTNGGSKGSRSGTLSSQSPPSSSKGSLSVPSFQRVNQDVEPWDSFLREFVKMWVNVVSENSAVAKSNPGLRIPLFVIFTKVDLLPLDAPIEKFRADATRALVEGEVAADGVYFWNVLERSDAASAAVEELLCRCSRLIEQRVLPLLNDRTTRARASSRAHIAQAEGSTRRSGQNCKC